MVGLAVVLGLTGREQQVSLLSNGEGREDSWDSTEVQRLCAGLASLSQLSSIFGNGSDGRPQLDIVTQGVVKNRLLSK